jgi:hypothetical protein
MSALFTRGLPVLLIAAGLTALWIYSCSGPDPVVRHVRLEAPRADGEPYVVSARVHNTRFGKGEVTVVFQLTDRRSGEAYQAEVPVQLQENGDAFVSAEIRAPPGDYEASAEAIYPPQ